MQASAPWGFCVFCSKPIKSDKPVCRATSCRVKWTRRRKAEWERKRYQNMRSLQPYRCPRCGNGKSHQDLMERRVHCTGCRIDAKRRMKRSPSGVSSFRSRSRPGYEPIRIPTQKPKTETKKPISQSIGPTERQSCAIPITPEMRQAARAAQTPPSVRHEQTPEEAIRDLFGMRSRR
jgi:predicted nucleic acid-binding Zn ribbon protein